MKTIACVFARGGSAGIPRKNLQDLGGKPLIAHAIECGLTTPGVSEVVVSTDDSEIADVARSFGARVPFLRPAELASDTAPERGAWQHAVRFLIQESGAFDCLLSLPTTAPLRVTSDISKVLEEFQKPDTDVVVTVTPGRRSPYFNMLKLEPSGHASLVCQSVDIARRQDAPAIFDMTTVAYAVRPEFVLSQTPMLGGRVRIVEIPAERAFDIDDPIDLEIVRFLFAKRLQK